MEQKAAHTPGPWFVAANGLNKVATITKVTGIYSDVAPDDKSIAADARLITAAPELLAALIGVVKVADRTTVEFDAARAAIAKAEGGAA